VHDPRLTRLAHLTRLVQPTTIEVRIAPQSQAQPPRGYATHLAGDPRRTETRRLPCVR
jgi:hypothetical protein